MSLGSMFGNDYPESAISLLSTWRCVMQEHDRLLIGMDGTTDLKQIRQSYDDEDGHFEKFIINGFINSNRVRNVEVGCLCYHRWWRLSDELQWFNPSQWGLSRELVQHPHIMHRFVLTANDDICATNDQALKFLKGQRIECYRAFKLGIEEMRRRFRCAGLHECCDGWQSPSGRISKELFQFHLCIKKS